MAIAIATSTFARPNVGAQRAFHERDWESVLDFGKDDDCRKILNPVIHWIQGEDGDPLHSANLPASERGGQAVNAFLSVVVKDLHDLLRKQKSPASNAIMAYSEASIAMRRSRQPAPSRSSCEK
ncbi:MAG: hypothetical protein ACI92S_003336 [Planctomycetaceae bacterium]|jgi:hypothetical protein